MFSCGQAREQGVVFWLRLEARGNTLKKKKKRLIHSVNGKKAIRSSIWSSIKMRVS